ncbi:MAG: Rieske 2Fe-2S domain-containing protein [Polyangiales bacterium]
MAREEEFPWGWFGVGFVSDLRDGHALAATVNGHELAIYRGASGTLTALDARCPHLGAHMGHGGTVEGDALRCHFHGFCFDADGRCTRTGYGGRVPPKARVRSHPVIDFGGVLAVWWHPEGAAPLWTPEFPDRAGWSAPRSDLWTFPGRPQEIAENSVDLGHLSVVHGYGTPTVQGDVRFEGPVLRATIRFRRPPPILGRRGPWMNITIHITQHGLGLASVESLTEELGIETRFVVSSASLDAHQVALRTTASARSLRHHPRLKAIAPVLPTRALDAVLMRVLHAGFASDVAQDVPIWTHKKPLESPCLAEGDGPLGRYRSWTRQFYRGAHTRLAVVGDASGGGDPAR